MKPTWTVKELWEIACKYDKIDPKAKFVIFSNNNPWVDRYNKAMDYHIKMIPSYEYKN